MLRKKKCRVCGSLFEPKKKTQILCDDLKCKKTWKNLQKRKKRSARFCVVCGSIFTVSQDSKQLCCGPDCTHEYAKKKKRERYWDDPKTHKEKQKAWYRKNAEKVKRYVKAWEKAHPERRKQYRENYAGKESSKQKKRDYYKANRQHIIDKMAKWRRENPERYNALTSKAKFKAYFGGMREIVLELADSRCQKCGTSNNLHVHHIDGDKTNNDLANLVVLCRVCHGKRHFKRVNPLDGPTTQKARRRLRASGLYNKVIEAAGFKCEICQCEDRLLVIHHIDGNPKNNGTDNLAVLCNSCHTKLHRGNFKLL